MLGYNLFRVVFLFYFVWLLSGIGWLTLGIARRRGVTFQLAWEDRLLLDFFLGAAVVTLVMLPLGILKLYYTTTALALSVPILVLSYPQLVRELREAAVVARRIFVPANGWKVDQIAKVLLVAAGLLLALVMLLTRCLYPGETGNDSYEIYWPYQRLVVESHSLWPNDVWYMFYAFKGAGVNFLGMLLSDEMASQSVGFCMLLAGIGVVYSVVKKIGGSATWALLASVTSLACFPFTNPKWGAFQSHHVVAGVWLVCMVWMAVLTFDRTGMERRAWFAVWAVLAAGEAIFFPLFLVFVFPLLGAMCAGYLLAKQFGAARGYFLVGLGAGAAAAGLMLLNYSIGGMFLDNPVRLMWKFADQARYSRWCSPYLEMFLLEASAPETGGISLTGFLSHDFDFWLSLFHVKSLGLLWIATPVPLILAAFAVAAAFVRPPGHSVRLMRVVPLLIPLGVCVLVVNTNHPDSVYRNYGFVCFFLPALLCLLWQAAFESLLPVRPRSALAAFFAVLVAGVSVYEALDRCSVRLWVNETSRWPDFIGFATGNLSVRDALARGDGLWPAAEGARSVVGTTPRIFTFNYPVGDASMLFPGDGVLTEPSHTSLGRDWDVVAFGDAEKARAALKDQKINYFLIDFNVRFRGALAYSPLFDPDHLAERFDLVWTGDGACLLTWRGEGMQPAPPFIVQAWRQRVRTNRKEPYPHPDGVMGRLYDNMKIIYDYNQGKGYPLRRPPDLPRVPGWQ